MADAYSRTRYEQLASAGFQVIDSAQANIMHNLLERHGGHFVDMGMGVELISNGRVAVCSGVVPMSFTATGLELSDGTKIDADAVVWGTGFRDSDIRQVLDGILGVGADEIAARMDATWALDYEGEIRGMWKRHEQVDRLWVVGFDTPNHRWQSRFVALQIKADIEGIQPPAYRRTPTRPN